MTASFLDEVRTETAPPGPRCKTCIMLDRLDPDLRQQIEDALNEPAVTSTAITKALLRRGITDASCQSIRRHRRGHNV